MDPQGRGAASGWEYVKGLAAAGDQGELVLSVGLVLCLVCGVQCATAFWDGGELGVPGRRPACAPAQPPPATRARNAWQMRAGQRHLSGATLLGTGCEALECELPREHGITIWLEGQVQPHSQQAHRLPRCALPLCRGAGRRERQVRRRLQGRGRLRHRLGAPCFASSPCGLGDVLPCLVVYTATAFAQGLLPLPWCAKCVWGQLLLVVAHHSRQSRARPAAE